MSYGPTPWVQQHWDLRAAANFVAGGAGSGLVLVSVASGAGGRPTAIALVAGLALVGIGLFAVWLEIGRPLRALNVFANPRTSWMSREAIAALVLGAFALAGAWAHLTGSALAPSLGYAAALAALVFAWCQGRILRAAKGIPAWRSPVMPALIVATALAEGAGLWWIAAAWHAQGTRAGLVAFGVLLVVRLAAWLAYRRSIAGNARASAALAPAGRVLAVGGSFVPLALVAIAAVSASEGTVLGLAAAAGALAVAAGALFKAAMIVRGAYNQGFALPRMPVRGRRA
ncbi:MAG TPA: dimethyl sulfoxide reductase anchor subunit [Casimicrobiaceae bacterium]|nr:dimethyl sulfoxide reductase anchor subunit [Casimicrobiaceae bacterium]